MAEFFQNLFRGDFLPHGWCYRWAPEVVWLHVTSDLLIALAYYFIPFALIYILRRRGDLVYPWMFWLFGVFILACGTTHLLSVLMVWYPWYRLDGIVKMFTAIASVPTAILLIRVAPAIVALPSPEQLRRLNRQLAREVTDRKTAEQEVRALNEELEQRVHDRTRELEAANIALHESESRLRLILDSTPLLVYMKDAEDRMVFVNREYEKALAVDRSTVVGKAGTELYTAELAKAYREADLQVWQDGKPHEFEESALHQDGTMHTYMSAKFPLFGLDGKPFAICGMSTDITERKAAESQLRRYAADLEQFAFIAAHDLQEPLRMVKSYTQLLLRRNPECFDRDAHQFAEFVTTGVDRMHELITDLQSYSEVARRAAKSNETADATEVLNETLRSMDLMLREGGAEVQADALPRVMLSSRALGQVFQNLIGNAVKYRSPDRPLQIRITSRCAERMCHITVTDNGIGFDQRYAEQIFKVFRRLHSRTIPGTGVGLAIVKGLVEGSGGRVWATSAPDQGASFHLIVPVAPDQA